MTQRTPADPSPGFEWVSIPVIEWGPVMDLWPADEEDE